MIWCVLLFVSVLIYCGAQAYGWFAFGRHPDRPPQTWIGWLRTAGGVFASVFLTAAYGAITGTAVMVGAALLRRLRSPAESRER
jgi:hypothetical protein